MKNGMRLDSVYIRHLNCDGTGTFINCAIVTVRYGWIELWHYHPFYLYSHLGGKPFRRLKVDEWSVTI